MCIQIFKERGHEVDYKVGLPKEELLKIIPDYDGQSHEGRSIDQSCPSPAAHPSIHPP